MNNKNLLLETFKCNPSATFFLCVFILLLASKLHYGTGYPIWILLDCLMIGYNTYNLYKTYQELKFSQ